MIFSNAQLLRGDSAYFCTFCIRIRDPGSGTRQKKQGLDLIRVYLKLEGSSKLEIIPKAGGQQQA